MATISRAELISAFDRLGELAAAEGEHVELLLLGGSVMVLEFQERTTTRDVDVVIVSPIDRAKVRRLAENVAAERGWPMDWLNEGAKGFVIGSSVGKTLISISGLTVRMPALEQLLAMKLGAWRDDVDISDASRLLKELADDRRSIWSRVEKYLQPGKELKAKYAFDDLWESIHGST